MRRVFSAKKLNNKLRDTHGFTMAEVLMVVAILGVLAAVSFMSVFTIQRNMSQTRADKNAEIIFEAAQRQLVSIKAFDYAGQKALEEKDFLYAAPGNDRGTLETLLLKDQVSEDLYQDGWVVEYEPTSFQVKAVYYYEDGDMGFYNNASTNAAITSGREERLNHLKNNGQLVGYYGGDASSHSSSDLKLTAKLEVKNGEELTANAGIIVSGDLPDDQKYQMIVTTEGKTSGAKLTQTVEFTKLQLSPVSGKHVGGVSLVLDSIKGTPDHPRFNNSYGKISEGYAYFTSNGTTNGTLTASVENASQNFYPGEDLDITVAVQTTESTLKDTISYSVNSLYEKAEGYHENEVIMTGENRYVASIGCGRHLQNLDTQTSGFDLSKFCEGDNAKMQAKQTKDLDFSAADSEWIKTYGDPQKKFRPITNQALDEYSGGSKPGEFVIKGLLVDASQKSYAGLFAEYFGTSIENVTLVNEKIDGASTTMTTEGKSGSIGGLTGNVARTDKNASTRLTINGCQIYLDEEGINKEGNVSRMNHAICIGGLVGYAKRDVTIQYSSASTVISDAFYVGGLIGKSDNFVDLENSYADCYLSGNYYDDGSNRIGGLIGFCPDSSKIYGCYSAGIITDPLKGAVAGMAPCRVVSVSESYTLVDFGKPGVNSITAFYPTVSDTPNVSETYYVHARFDIPRAQKFGTDISLSEMKNKNLPAVASNPPVKKFTHTIFAFTEDTAYERVATPYSFESNGLSAYPYPMIILSEEDKTLLPHYGDWREGLRTLDVNLKYAGANHIQQIEEYQAISLPELTGDKDDYEYWKFTYEGVAYYYVAGANQIYEVSKCQTSATEVPWATAGEPVNDISNPLSSVVYDMEVVGYTW